MCILRKDESKDAQLLINQLETVSLANEEDPEDQRAELLSQLEAKSKAFVANYLKQNKNRLSERELMILGMIRTSSLADNKDF